MSGGVGGRGGGLLSQRGLTLGQAVVEQGELGGTANYSYCVSGTTLSLTPQSAGRTGTLTGTVELQQ